MNALPHFSPEFGTIASFCAWLVAYMYENTQQCKELRTELLLIEPHFQFFEVRHELTLSDFINRTKNKFT